MTSSHQRPTPCQSFSRLGSVLDRRSAPRLVLMLVGAVLAHESSRNTIHILTELGRKETALAPRVPGILGVC
jgi:hypothetical protein